MSGRVERIARAMSQEDLGTEEQWPYYFKMAKAAIWSMCEPSDEMIEAGAEVDDAGGDFSVGRTAAAAVYKAMVMASLPKFTKEAA